MPSTIDLFGVQIDPLIAALIGTVVAVYVVWFVVALVTYRLPDDDCAWVDWRKQASSMRRG